MLIHEDSNVVHHGLQDGVQAVDKIPLLLTSMAQEHVVAVSAVLGVGSRSHSVPQWLQGWWRLCAGVGSSADTNRRWLRQCRAADFKMANRCVTVPRPLGQAARCGSQRNKSRLACYNHTCHFVCCCLYGLHVEGSLNILSSNERDIPNSFQRHQYQIETQLNYFGLHTHTHHAHTQCMYNVYYIIHILNQFCIVCRSTVMC
jgi:hypothetical protein